ncbi:MAG: hypothetical protein JWL73_1758 [Actinomycetia bacterium]|nr:hypothetical protein [Actinomycetes bacterium]
MTPGRRSTGTIAAVDEQPPGTEPAASGVGPRDPAVSPPATPPAATFQPAAAGLAVPAPSSLDLAPRDDPEADEIPVPPPTMASTTAMIGAFVAVMLAGAFGATIGYGLVDISARGKDPGFSAVIGMVIGAAIGAGGVAVVAVLVLRTMGDWAKHPARGPDALPDRPKPPAA